MEASHDILINILNSLSNNLLVFSKLGMSLKLFSDNIEEIFISFPEIHMVHFLCLFA